MVRADRNVFTFGERSALAMHGEMMGGHGGHQMGGTGMCRELLKKRAWEYLDEDQTRALILRLIDKKILALESRMELGRQKVETLQLMREMIAAGSSEESRTTQKFE